MFGLVPYRRNFGLKRKDGFNDIADMVDSFFNDSPLAPFISEINPLRGNVNSMRADIKETDDEFIVDVEVPGVKKEDIKLDLRDDVLSICVEQNEEVSEEKDNYIRKERRYGSCSRSFYVPDIKHDAVSAKYADGILTVTLPKADEVKQKNRKIDIE
ncbi:MAG TPA: Hsp20/alpha crystallin family protein [Clostridiales bacterium]|nr:Hsp20/alpha crystallin family protein [Clostridiales bacterium]